MEGCEVSTCCLNCFSLDLMLAGNSLPSSIEERLGREGGSVKLTKLSGPSGIPSKEREERSSRVP